MPHLRSLMLVLALCFLAAGTPDVFAQATDTAPVATPATPPTVFENPALVQRYQQTITPEDLAAHLYLFASDFFEGRETTTRGQKLAAYYLASQYRKMGLAPKGTAATDDPYAPQAYFQPFDVYGSRLDAARLTVTTDGQTVATNTFSADRQDEHAYLTFGSAPSVDAPVVFAGYGIADDELKYNDYAALQAQGITTADKWVLILRDEPLAGADESLLPTADGQPSAWSKNFYQKLRAARTDAGFPRGFLIVGDIGPRADASVVEAARREAAGLTSVGSLSLTEESGRTFPPVYTISSELANQILAPTGRTVQELKAEIDDTLEPVVLDVPGVQVQSEITSSTFKAGTENVLAFVEGTDPELKDEVVVISSHYDHVGIDPTLEGDQIHNGADDDGSGTVSTLEIAEAFMKAKADGYGPRRSILFLNVAGEEKGLLGSAYYADQEPVLPVDQTVTNLNIDMIGRHDPTYEGNDPNYIYIIGSNLISQELHDINMKVNDVTDVDLVLSERFNSKDDPNRFYARSDHWNFGKHGVPFIFFFSGTHEDYHRPGDEADKIDYARMADVARLIFGTAWQVANQDARPAVSGTGFN